MDKSKLPYRFLPNPDLQDIQPLTQTKQELFNQTLHSSQSSIRGKVILKEEQETSSSTSPVNAIDFPPLEVFDSTHKQSEDIRLLRQ